MLNKKMEEELNKQLAREVQASYLYLSMSAYCDHVNMDGFAKWCLIQAQEEVQHVMKFFNYIRDREGRVTLQSVPQPKTEFKSLIELFETAVANERELGDKINELASLALELKDNASYQFLQWFLNEQVEEVAITTAVVEKLKLVGDNGHGLLILNNELGARQPEPAGGEAE